jgi:hypothetical protein
MAGVAEEFELPIKELTNISNLKFYSTEKYIHAVWNNKNHDRGIYLSSSSDNGRTFTSAKNIIQTQGEVKDLQIIARDNHIVITIIETISDRDYVRASTGTLNNDMTYNFEPCEKSEVEGEIINAYTIFKDESSEDHIYFKPKDSSEQIARRTGTRVGGKTQRHIRRGNPPI